MSMSIKEKILYEFKNNIKDGLYSKSQILLAKSSNNIEGYKITNKETKDMFVTKDLLNMDINSSDMKEQIIVGHFLAFNEMLKNIDEPLSEKVIKYLHRYLMKDNFEFILKGGIAGSYKTTPNMVAGKITTLPENVPTELDTLLQWYNKENKTLDTITKLHYRFEIIHPFKDGNGRVGRLIVFREMLKYLDTIFFIDDEDKENYFEAFKSEEAMIEYFKMIYDKIVNNTKQNILAIKF